MNRVLFGLLLALLALLQLHSSQAALPVSQIDAMADLCAVLNTTVGWNCVTHPCSWNLVSCDSTNSSILSIDIHRKDAVVSLNKALPASFANLVDLEELVLNGLGLISPLPNGIGTMNSLLKIDLACNRFSQTLPHFQNTPLTHLNVSSNAFNGSFPSLDSLPSIQILDISNNKFGGLILPHTFLLTPNITTLIGSNNTFSGNVSFLSNVALSIIDMSDNEFELCDPEPETSWSASETCKFLNQRSPCASCASAWSQCQTSATNVDCGNSEPSVPSEATPIESGSPIYFVPLSHCWESVGNKTYAYFGYESSVSMGVEAVNLNVLNGIVITSPNETYSEGRVPLSIVISVVNVSEPVGLSFGVGEIQEMEISVSTLCPNISLQMLVSYPSAPNMTNLVEDVHDLYVEYLPYPANLLQVENDGIAKRAPGDLNVVLYPGSEVSAYVAISKLVALPLPESSETGEATGGRGTLKTEIPTSGGSSSPITPLSDTPIRPPSLTSSAIGAITICVILGVAIVSLAILLNILGRRSKLPTVQREHQDKSNRLAQSKEEV